MGCQYCNKEAQIAIVENNNPVIFKIEKEKKKQMKMKMKLTLLRQEN